MYIVQMQIGELLMDPKNIFLFRSLISSENVY